MGRNLLNEWEKIFLFLLWQLGFYNKLQYTIHYLQYLFCTKHSSIYAYLKLGK